MAYIGNKRIGFSPIVNMNEGGDLPLSVIIGTWQNADGTAQYIFNKGGTCTQKAPLVEVTVNGTFTLSKNIVTITLEGNSEPFSATYSYVDGKDIINDGVYKYEKVKVKVNEGLQWKCDNTKDLRYYFANCTAESLDDQLAGVDTSQVTNMERLFGGCSNLKSMNVALDVSNATNTDRMFFYNENITYIKPFNPVNTTNAQAMFCSCKKLTNCPILSIGKASSIEGIFLNCYELTELSELDFSNVTNMRDAFNCSSIVRFPNINATKCTSFRNAFNACNNALSIESLDTSSATDMYWAFRMMSKLEIMPALNTSKVTNFSNTFASCTALTTILGELDLISGTTGVTSMFNSCNNLATVTLKNIKINLQLGWGTSWGHKLTLDSLINAIKELWNMTDSSSNTLTIGSANLTKLANVYVKLVDITDEMRANDEYIDNKLPFEVCESTDEGAMLITDYALLLKNWSIE